MTSQATSPPELAAGAGTAELLQRLISVDTVNPPGNERVVQELLASMLTDAGFDCTLVGAEPERPNLVARLAGEADGPVLSLLGHTDTVRADPGEWAHDPWGGELIAGEVWGRGAQDMKGQVAAEVGAASALGRSGWRPARGELKLLIVADEETGGELGAQWLCSEHPELARSDFVVNEGGGQVMEIGDRRVYPYSVGEKGISRFRIRTHGTAGHASVPGLGDNALLKLAPIVAKLTAQPPLEPNEHGMRFLSAALGEELSGDDGMSAGVERLRTAAPLIATYLAEPILSVTMSPTRIEASHKANVIPSEAWCLVDCRVPPGYGEAEVRERIEALLGPEEGYEIEFTERIVGSASPPESALSEAIGAWLAEEDPGAELAPTVMPGFSDSNWLRGAFPEAVVYGFCPAGTMGLLDAAPLIHAADERVPVSDLEMATRFFADLPRRMLG